MNTSLNTTENVTVEDLRKHGYKVRVKHYRKSRFDGKLWHRALFDEVPELISTRGGKTIVEITTPDLKNLTGEARCSNNDTFNRKTGLYMAIRRALQQV